MRSHRLTLILSSVVDSLQRAHAAAPDQDIPLQDGVGVLDQCVALLGPEPAQTTGPVKTALIPLRLLFPEAPPAKEPKITEAEVAGCKALLLEVIRRASYDWVLYRTSKVLQKRKLAEDAFNWLFKEGPGHPDWIERQKNKKDVMSFLAICESLDLDPHSTRNHIRRLTVKNVMSIGRPAEYRRRDVREEDDSYSTASMGERLLPEYGIDDFEGFDEG